MLCYESQVPNSQRAERALQAVRTRESYREEDKIKLDPEGEKELRKKKKSKKDPLPRLE
jgi:hypothetical protein